MQMSCVCARIFCTKVNPNENTPHMWGHIWKYRAIGYDTRLINDNYEWSINASLDCDTADDNSD